jgi:hypothetical protein
VALVTHARGGDPSVAAVNGDRIAVAGPVEIAGPDDALPGMPADRAPQLPRDIDDAAGGRSLRSWRRPGSCDTGSATRHTSLGTAG